MTLGISINLILLLSQWKNTHANFENLKTLFT